jgi:hypothetical protein
VGSSESEGGRDVRGPEAACDHGGAAVDERVEAASRGVVARILGQDDGAGQLLAELVRCFAHCGAGS